MRMRTERLELVAATLDHIEAEMESPERLGRLLGADVPASWPPGEYDRSAMEFFHARLSENPGAAGWYGWYAIHHPENGAGAAAVIGAGGYLGPPGPDGVVEIGYSIAPEFHARAFATELVRALTARAFAAAAAVGAVVVRVIAHTNETNAASKKVLERCGFAPAGPADGEGTVEYEILRPAAEPLSEVATA